MGPVRGRTSVTRTTAFRESSLRLSLSAGTNFNVQVEVRHESRSVAAVTVPQARLGQR
jgi:hypothetical protein